MPINAAGLSRIVLLMPKGHRQFWWLIALSLLQLAISGVLSTGAAFGAAMLSMMLLLLWTMSVIRRRLTRLTAGGFNTRSIFTRLCG